MSVTISSIPHTNGLTPLAFLPQFNPTMATVGNIAPNPILNGKIDQSIPIYSNIPTSTPAPYVSAASLIAPVEFDFQKPVTPIILVTTPTLPVTMNGVAMNGPSSHQSSPQPTTAAAVPSTPPKQRNLISDAQALIAKYQRHSYGSPSGKSASISSPSTSLPKRTVLSVVAQAYLTDDPSLVEDFDPLQPTRNSKGLPKNAQEFWKYMESYFNTPNAKDLDFLAKYAFPDGELVELEWDEMEAERKAGVNTELQAGSSSNAARAARRGRGTVQAAIETKAQRQQLLESLRSVEQVREDRIKLETLITQAKKVLETPSLPSPAPPNENTSISSPSKLASSNGSNTTNSSPSSISTALIPQSPNKSELSPELASNLQAAYQRYLDSRMVCEALESSLPLHAHQCTETQLSLILQAVWKFMRQEEKSKFHSLQLPLDAFSSVTNAATAFYDTLPPPPLPPTPVPALVPTSDPNQSPTAALTAPSSGSKSKDPDNEDDEDENELDVDKLTLYEAEEMLEKLEYENQSTACRLQHLMCRYMIGSWNARNPQNLETVQDESAVQELKEMIAYAQHGVVMNPRSSRPFSFSLTGTFSRRANDKRRMDLNVTKEEKETIDRWISYVDAQKYWLQRKEDDDDVAPSRPGAGMGAGKGPAERIDPSVYNKPSSSATASEPKNYLFKPQQPAVPIEEEEPDIVCCVCGDGDCEDDNQIIFCDRCDIAVHQDCYGQPLVPEGEWYCSPCSMLISKGFTKQSPLAPQYSCAVCWKTGGAMKRLLIEKKNYKKTLQVLNSGEGKPPTQLTFAHVACALWLGELYLQNPDEMSPICGLHNVNPQRFKLKCSLCKLPGGACVQCSEKKCCLAFHMQCALEHGLQLDTINDSSSETGSRYVIWCEKHRNTPRINISLKATDGQVQGGGPPQCQICCYNVTPIPIEGVTNEMLSCTDCGLNVHHWCYGRMDPKSQHHTRSSPMEIEEIVEGESKSQEPTAATVLHQPTQPPPTANGNNASTPPNVATSSAVVRKFLCRVCEARRKLGADASETPSCALCLATQGALKPTEDGRWVCLPCTYFTPELFFGDTEGLEPIKGVEKAFKARSKLACCICDRPNGCPVQCFNSRCETAYHVGCAYAQGWEFKANPKDSSKNNLPFISYCGAHSRVATGPSTDITSNPLFANATFSSFTLPEESSGEEIVEDPSSLKQKRNSGGGGGSNRKRKNRNNDSDLDTGDDDSVMLIDDSDDELGDGEAYLNRTTKSRGGGSVPLASSKLRLSSGVGQLTFEGKKRQLPTASSTPTASVARPKQKIQKIYFYNDRAENPVPVFIAIRDLSGTSVFENAPVAKKHKHKIKTSAAVDIIKTGDENDDGIKLPQEESKSNMDTSDTSAPTASSSSTAPLPHLVDEVAAHRLRLADSGDVASYNILESSRRSATPKVAGESTSSTNQSKLKAKRRQKKGGTAAATSMAPLLPVDEDEEMPDPDEELFCRCRQPYRPNQATMIGCEGDDCKGGGWFHLICLGITGEEANKVMKQKNWMCPDCEAK